MELNTLFPYLTLNNGIFYSQNQNSISYPTEGNELCFQLEDNSYWFKHRNEIITELAKKFTLKNDFWDIGGGNGCVTQALQKNEYDTILIEPGQSGVINAKKRNIRNIICADLESLETGTPFMNNVGLFDVIEHVENDNDFLKNVYAKTNHEGLIFISVPAYKMLWSNEDVYAGHFRRYTLSSITKLVKETGFDVMYQSYAFTFLFIPVFLFRTLPSKFSKNKKTDPDKVKNQHSNKGSLQYIFRFAMNWELQKIKNGKKIPFGSSCFVVAKKNSR